MKKIRLLIPFWDLDIGGIQTIIRDLVIYLNRVHPEIKITILIRGKTDTKIAKDILRRTRAKIYSVKEGRIVIFRHFSLWLFYLYYTYKPDILLTFLRRSSVPSIVLRRVFFWRNVKIVLNEGIVTSKYNTYQERPRLWQFLISVFYPHADTIIVPSFACKTDLISHFSVPEKKIVIGRNWTLLSKKPSCKRIYDLIYVGRFDKEKNVIALLELVKRLRPEYPRIVLCLVGKGEKEEQLRRRVEDDHLQKNVFFAGYQSDIISYLNKSKIFVMTTHNEGSPVALLEAGSQRLPAVVSHFIGSDEFVIHGKTGYIADSTESMCLYIKKLLHDNEMRKIMGIEAQQFVQSHYGKHNMEIFVQLLLGL